MRQHESGAERGSFRSRNEGPPVPPKRRCRRRSGPLYRALDRETGNRMSGRPGLVVVRGGTGVAGGGGRRGRSAARRRGGVRRGGWALAGGHAASPEMAFLLQDEAPGLVIETGSVGDLGRLEE